MKHRRLIISWPLIRLRPGINAIAMSMATVVSASSAKAQDGPPPAPVRLGVVLQETVQPHRLIVGNIVAAKRAEVAAELAGRVLTPPPDAGRSVRKGDILVQTDTTLLSLARAAVAAERQELAAQLAQRQAQLNRAQREAAYLKQLAERNATPEKELRDAQDAVLVAEAERAETQAAEQRLDQRLAQLDEQIQRMTLRAPFDGQVVRKDTETGEWLEPGDTVAELVQTAPIDAVFDAPEAIVHRVQPGIPVLIQLRAIDTDRQGVVDRIVPEVDRITRTFPVVIRLDNQDGMLKPGMTAEVLAPVGQAQTALTIPRDALLQTNQGTMVYVNRQGVAALTPVRKLFETPGRFAITTGNPTPGNTPGTAPGIPDGSGLKAGDQIVIEGNERLFPGQPLMPLPGPENSNNTTP